MSIRVVLDTSVLVSALHFAKGNPREVLRFARLGFFEVYFSEYILKELREVLAKKFKWEKRRISAVLKLFQVRFHKIATKEKIHLIKDNKGDNEILACALTCKAHFLVTSDMRHLLKLQQVRSTKIVSPKEFLLLLENLHAS